MSTSPYDIPLQYAQWWARERAKRIEQQALVLMAAGFRIDELIVLSDVPFEPTGRPDCVMPKMVLA